MRADLDQSIRRALVLPDPAALALPADVLGLGQGLDLEGRDLVALADRGRVVPGQFRLRGKLLVRSVRLDALVAETSSIRRPKKVR
ncbi:MAG TPA: hypothetical protein VLT57_16735 [Bryobacteraceae bacterium]|nr:hypothetical protein [Bryobacteraceae bacterium]